MQSVDPIYVDFRLPQQQLASIAVGETVRVTTDAFPGQSFEGRINAIDPRVDPATRNFQTEASVGTPSGVFLPGMFARCCHRGQR